jgi:hypothetical protein
MNSRDSGCPPTVRVPATHIGANGASAVVAPNAGNVDRLNGTSRFGEATGSQTGIVRLGLPFFTAARCLMAIAGTTTSAGPGLLGMLVTSN